MTEWQSIDTAPNGPVLVWDKERKRAVVAKRSGWADYFLTQPGYWQVRPTHWQPLPIAPSDDMAQHFEQTRGAIE